MKHAHRISLFIIMLFTAHSLQAQMEDVLSYIGVSGGHLFMAGSFDGMSYFQTDEDILLVPEFRHSFGVGASVGLTFSAGALEAGYFQYRSEYSTMNPDYYGDCTTHVVRFLGVERYFDVFANPKIRPYMDLDMSVSFSNFTEIAYPIGQEQDPARANYSAFVVGLGGGILIHFSEKIAMDLKILPEYYMGTDIRVRERERYEITKFGNFMIQSTLGLNYYFIKTN